MIGIYEEMGFEAFSKATTDYFGFDACCKVFDTLLLESKTNNEPFLFTVDAVAKEWKECICNTKTLVEILQQVHPNFTEIYRVNSTSYLIRLEVPKE